ncbi:MAG TPA: aminotransferase, partial [candidate division Zixibacteria bacterium]|nr:aminotransferase [candidate division Zixibacteria bacterium]
MNEMWHYSRRAIMMKSSVIRETLKITQKPGIISFGGGLPAPELFPKEELAEAAQKVIREQGEKALQYP